LRDDFRAVMVGDASVANPKFASAWATLWANFGFKPH